VARGGAGRFADRRTRRGEDAIIGVTRARGGALQKIGKFEIVAVLGQGAMGTVYRARDPILDRMVALKTVSPELLTKRDTMARFQREARAAAKLQHPNVVIIYELGEEGGTLFIAMELLEGMDLAQAMDPPDRLSVKDKVRIMVDVCRGLDYAHKNGVVHRDIKPANIRLLKDGTVKIVDFGIARTVDSQMTQTGLILGTPSYIAPEVLAEGRVDHRADMWAVGIMLYEMLAGRRPYDAPTIAGLVYRIVHQPPPPLDPVALRIPPALAEVTAIALAKDPGARFQDMAEMGRALENAAGLTGRGDVPLTPEARERAYALNFDEAKRLLLANDLERALEAARRAQALEPSRRDVLALIETIEQQLTEAPTLINTPRPLPTVNLPLTPVEEARPGPPPAAPGRGLPTPVLTELRLRGAAVFRELATFGEPPSTAAAGLSPAGDLLATAGSDGALRLWDLHTRTRVKTFRTELHQRTGHDAMAGVIAFSPDGGLLASGHVDGAVHLWNVEVGEEYPVRLRHDALVGAIAFSPDGSVLASGGMDSNLKLWEVRAAVGGEARRELLRQPSGVTSLAYAGRGAWIATGHANRVIRVHDAKTLRLVATLRGPEAQVSLLAAAPDGRRLAAASHDRTIRLFDLGSRTELFSVGGHRRPTTSLSFFSDGTHFATVALDNAVLVWDCESRATIAALWGQAEESFAAVSLFRGGDHIAVALADGRIRLWGPAA
jgi:serine/threonine protein kinase